MKKLAGFRACDQDVCCYIDIALCNYMQSFNCFILCLGKDPLRTQFSLAIEEATIRLHLSAASTKKLKCMLKIFEILYYIESINNH